MSESYLKCATWKGSTGQPCGIPPLMSPTTPVTELLVTAALFEPFGLWWAQQQDPALRDRPLVGILADRVVHATPAARREGITPGLPLAAARLKTSNLQVVDTDPTRLGVQWSWQLAELNSWSPWLISPGVGRAWLMLKAEEASRLALEYRVQTGAASNRELALAAALLTPPGQLRTVEPGQEQQFLARLPLNRLPALGFPESTTERFAFLGIRSLGDLGHWKEAQLRSIAGPDAARLYRLLHGPHETQVPLYRPAPSVQASYAFDDPANEPFQLEPVVRLLAQRLQRRLTDRAASRVLVTTQSLGLKLPDELINREPVQDAGVLTRMIWRSLNRTGALGLGIDQLTVTLTDLTRLQQQPGLWLQKEARERAIRLVNRRFPGALLGFEPVDPYSLARDRRYRLFRLDTGETVPPPSHPAAKAPVNSDAPAAHQPARSAG